mmetsp:Transcript_46153/g.93156  ORF Transcript_46153/g.93156 Transcript_46153/m.93156 type:complete len:145 (+) Transcript_46153:22-456(+)
MSAEEEAFHPIANSKVQYPRKVRYGAFREHGSTSTSTPLATGGGSVVPNQEGVVNSSGAQGIQKKSRADVPTTNASSGGREGTQESQRTFDYGETFTSQPLPPPTTTLCNAMRRQNAGWHAFWISAVWKLLSSKFVLFETFNIC